MSKDITDELIIREDTSGYSFEKSGATMEQDIDDLKELRKELGLYADKNKIKQGIALEHLIKAYKEQNGIIKIANIAIKDLQEKLKNYIPVSLVEEKIEEYQNNMKLYENETHNIFNENNIRQEVITVLQELLEKRK